MSHHIPFEIQIEIAKRLPVKSLIQFRSVKKQWKSLIDSSDFITGYNSLTKTQPQRLLIRSFNLVDEDYRYFSFIDDDTNFPEKAFSLTVPKSFDQLHQSIVGDSSHGLVCVICSSYSFVLWNPAIRKSVTIKFPGSDRRAYQYGFVFGFGVCPDTLDPKFVKIKRDIPLQVEVFSLSRGAWRSPLNLPFYGLWFIEPQVVMDRFICWLVYDYNHHKLMLFDLISENFSELYLPDCLARKPCWSLSISKLRESLVVFESNFEVNKPCYGVWMMTGHSALKSFTKLYNVSAPDYFDGKVNRILGFRKSGEPIIVMENNLGLRDVGGLFVYEPCTKNVNDLGIVGDSYLFYVTSYRETLLLLDHRDI